MVEVPVAALLAHRMLEVVDFLSIGTNDLTQYTMAADRMATDLAHLTDPWQPAVLQLIAITAEAGQAAGKPVGVCGEAAADPLLACVLVGHGHHVAVDGPSAGPPGRRTAVGGVAGNVRGGCPGGTVGGEPRAGARRRPSRTALRRPARCPLSEPAASQGSTVTLMASPFLTMSKASRTPVERDVAR